MTDFEIAIRDGQFAWNDVLIDAVPDGGDVQINEEELADDESGRVKSGSLDKEVVGSVFAISVDFRDINDWEFKQLREVKTTVFGYLTFWYAGEIFRREMSSSSIQSVKNRVTEDGVTIWDVHLEFSEKDAENRIKE